MTEHDIHMLSSTVERLTAENTALKSAIEADARDAARYRWLRDTPNRPPIGQRKGVPWAVYLQPTEQIHTMALCAQQELDSACDAALLAEAGKEKGNG